MKNNSHISFFDEERFFWHEFESPLNAHRDHWNLAFQCKEKSSSLKRLQFPVPAPGSFGKYQKGKSFLLDHAGGSVNTFLSSPQSFPVNRDKTHSLHGLTDNWKPEGLFFQDDSNGLRNEHKKQRTVNRAQVVAHENIGSPFVNPFKSGDFQTHAQDFLPETYRSFPDQKDEMRPPDKKADNDDRDEKNRDNSANYAKGNGAHDSMQRLYHIFLRKRNERSLFRQRILYLDIFLVLENEKTKIKDDAKQSKRVALSSLFSKWKD